MSTSTSTSTRSGGSASALARRLHHTYCTAWARQVDTMLTEPQYAVLSTVHAHPDVDQGTAARSVALDRSTMADVCRRLEGRGLISRVAAPDDSRRKLLSLTADGVAALSATRCRAQALEAELFADRSDAERRGLLDELTALAARWEAVADQRDAARVADGVRP